MRTNIQLFLTLCMIVIFRTPSKTLAQPGTTAPLAGDGYVIMKNGDTLNGRINWRMKYTENNPTEIKFIPEKGSPQVLNAGEISGLVIYPSIDFEGNEIPQENFISLPSMKKGTPVFYNRLLDGRLQVYQNRSSVIMTKETVEATTEFNGIQFVYSRETGLTIGPLFKTSYRVIESKTRFSSYFIIKDHGVFQKIDKDIYDSIFPSLFGDCPEIQQELNKNPDLAKFRNFMILAEVYNQLCR